MMSKHETRRNMKTLGHFLILQSIQSVPQGILAEYSGENYFVHSRFEKSTRKQGKR